MGSTPVTLLALLPLRLFAGDLPSAHAAGYTRNSANSSTAYHITNVLPSQLRSRSLCRDSKPVAAATDLFFAARHSGPSLSTAPFAAAYRVGRAQRFDADDSDLFRWHAMGMPRWLSLYAKHLIFASPHRTVAPRHIFNKHADPPYCVRHYRIVYGRCRAFRCCALHLAYKD